MYISVIICILIILFMIYAFIPSNIIKHNFFNKEKSKEKVIYLTFDDGPSEYTDILLDLLEKHNIKATFFCVANFARKYKDTIEMMKEKGHVIGLHSLKHKNFMLQGIIETKLDTDKSLKIMKNLGIEIKYYRPPWGDTNLFLLRYLKQRNLKLILWNVMAEDWEGNTSSEIIINKLLNRISNGDIICLHDGRGENEAPVRTIKALEEVIPKLLEKGFEFKTIDEYKN